MSNVHGKLSQGILCYKKNLCTHMKVAVYENLFKGDVTEFGNWVEHLKKPIHTRTLTTSSENSYRFTNRDKLPSAASCSISIRGSSIFDWIWIMILIKRRKKQKQD